MSLIQRASKLAAPAMLVASLVACSSNNKTQDDEFVFDEEFTTEEFSSDASSDDALAELEASLAEDSGLAPAQDESLLSEEAELNEAANADFFSTDSSDEELFAGASPATVQSVQPKQEYQGVQMPQVASRPFEKNGFTMNAFYFVQSDQETYSSLSKLFYNDTSRASLIQDWNDSKRVRAGEIIYYESPILKKDGGRMLSLYDDFGFDWVPYRVQRGDTLASISKRLYGHTKAWRNIAGYNPELGSPDALEVGQTIRLPDLNINTEAKLVALKREYEEKLRKQRARKQAQAELREKEARESAARQAKQNEVNNLNKQQDSQPLMQELDPPKQDRAKAANKAPSKRDAKELANIEDGLSTGGASTGPFSKEQLLYVGLGLVALSALLLIIRRKRRRSSAPID